MLEALTNLINVATNVITSVIYILGVYVIVVAIRFVKNDDKLPNIIDKTAGYLSFLFVIWSIASQRRLVSKMLPFVNQDLTEYLGIREPDDKDT